MTLSRDDLLEIKDLLKMISILTDNSRLRAEAGLYIDRIKREIEGLDNEAYTSLKKA